MKKPDLKNGKPVAKKLMGEFKAFAIKGNVIDLAVGVIIGAAFSKIVSSVVADIATPFLGMFIGGVNFKELKVDLPQIFPSDKPPVLNIGNFINTIIEFFTLAVIVFIIVKIINRLKKKQEEEKPVAAKPTSEELLLTEIRDILKEQKDK